LAGLAGKVRHIASAEPRIGWNVWLGSVAINLLSLALPLTILQAYDRILPNKALSTFTLLTLGVATALLLEMLLRNARVAVLGWHTARFESTALMAAVGRVLDAPVATINRMPVGALLDKIQSIDVLRNYHSGQSRLALIDLPFACIFIGFMFMIGGWIGVVPVMLTTALAPLNLRRIRAEEAVGGRRRKHEDHRTDFLVEVLRGIRTLKVIAAEPLIMRRHDRLQRTSVENSYQSLVLGNDNQSLMTLFANLVLIATVSYGAVLVIDGSISVGALAACTTLAGRAVQPVLRLFVIHNQLASVKLARCRLADVLSLPRDNGIRNAERISIAGQIELIDLGFSYPENDRPTFTRLDLTIPAGCICGITGLDLAGKSTLARLIAGELVPTHGRINIDGHDLNGGLRESIRPQVAYVSQERTLFEGTMLENIAMFRPAEATEEALAAARLIGLELDIQRLPQGYETRISDSIADEIPASLAQRVMIARALARRPRVLVFDQANAALDLRSDRLLREALAAIKGSMTVVLITERPSLLRVADTVLKLEAGALAAQTVSPQLAIEA
jgi:ATP-binding cassette subfamily C protein LapB